MGAWRDVRIVSTNGKFGMSLSVSIDIGHGGLVGFHYSVERNGKEDGWTKGEGKEAKENNCKLWR